MSLSLKKGGNVNLSKEAPGATKMRIGLGWSARAGSGAAFDLDASAFMLAANGKVRGDDDMIFYNQLTAKDGSVSHSGDNLTGDGDGDDETILIDFSKMAPGVDKISVCVTIHEALSRRQNFGMVDAAYVRCVNEDSGRKIARFDLSEDVSSETAMIFCEIYRHGGDWKFRAVGQGYKNGLGPLASSFGVDVR